MLCRAVGRVVLWPAGHAVIHLVFRGGERELIVLRCGWGMCKRKGVCSNNREDVIRFPVWRQYGFRSLTLGSLLPPLPSFLSYSPRLLPALSLGRWGAPSGQGLRLHLRDRVSLQSRRRAPGPTAHGTQGTERTQEDGAGHQVRMFRMLKYTLPLSHTLTLTHTHRHSYSSFNTKGASEQKHSHYKREWLKTAMKSIQVVHTFILSICFLCYLHLHGE